MSRLEDDFPVAASARDQLRKKLGDTEEAQASLQLKFDDLSKDLKAKEEMVNERTAERDAMMVQYDEFRKNLRDLLGKAEALLPKSESTLPIVPTSNKKPEADVGLPLPIIVPPTK
jgi:septal ring factor EnvC (AmiA/AmiB activator)